GSSGEEVQPHGGSLRDREGPALLPVAQLPSPCTVPQPSTTCPAAVGSPCPAPMTVCLQASSLVRQTRRFGVHWLGGGSLTGLAAAAGQP
ncbi:hypothetical protein N332_08170, partial [Mesitornis unicolor]